MVPTQQKATRRLHEYAHNFALIPTSVRIAFRSLSILPATSRSLRFIQKFGHWIGLRIWSSNRWLIISSNRGLAFTPRGEGLEARLALTTIANPIVMVSATTKDSKSVTIGYDVPAQYDAQHLLTFHFYRSSDSTFSPDDLAMGTKSIVAIGSDATTLDDNSQPAVALGRHQLTIPLLDGLVLNPKRPYVIVVANPDTTPEGSSPPTASFRKYTIGVVTHGGIQDKAWKNGPMWELVMAYSLKQQGYDAVIPYNWVSKSSTPGAAAKQGPRLAKMVLDAANLAPENEAVDIHFIGHSEGAVVNTVAINQLEKEITPAIHAGYLEDTLLDPHSANKSFTGRQYSTSGFLAPLAGWLIDGYQGRAKDPLASVPTQVDHANVFYQHNKAMASDIYNLWGQVPVRGSASYFNVTASGATHSGKTGVMTWYQHNIIPTLGDGSPALRTQTLSGKLDSIGRTEKSGTKVVEVAQLRFTGLAGPNSIVRLYAGPANHPSVIAPVGKSVAGPDGTWSITTQSLRDGRYRIVAMSKPPTSHARPRLIMNPTAPLGQIVVDTKSPN